MRTNTTHGKVFRMIPHALDWSSPERHWRFIQSACLMMVGTTPRRRRWLAPLLIAALLLVAYTQFGFYSIQPLGAIPEGGTVLVWRRGGEPFFNSPDGTWLRIQGDVSLFCRLGALGQAPVDRVVLRLPYQHWAYLASTGGQTFEQ